MNRALLFLIVVVLFVSCKKESFLTDPGSSITLSEDIIRFDTQFTGIRSTTRKLAIHNMTDQKMMLSSIALHGGAESPFQININGNPSGAVQNQMIDAGDSILIFVQAQIKPTTGPAPFLVKDSIEIILNGVVNKVRLEAYGQNANFFSNHEIDGTETWSSELPYVITGKLHVAPQATLRITKGTHLYFHDKAGVEVDGTLLIEGTADEKVVFAGDRLDEPYKYLAGTWQGIRLKPSSRENTFHWIEVHNAVDGISITGPISLGYQLEIENSVIDNCKESGIRSTNSAFSITNLLISNNGQAITISSGSKAWIKHCTIVGYSNLLVQRTAPLILVSDHGTGDQLVFGVTKILVENSIIWGDESYPGDAVGIKKSGNLQFSVEFKSSMLPFEVSDPLVQTSDCLLGSNPLFRNDLYEHGDYDFHLSETSPAINIAMNSAILTDLDNRPRDMPDLGCYEYLP